MECDKLLYPVDVITFDTAVNMGISTAKKFFQKSFR